MSGDGESYRPGEEDGTSKSADKMGKQILVVDDDPEVRKLLRGYLTEHGYRVQVAENGIEMNDMLGKHLIDLVILDLVLPGEDGLDLARQLRKRSNIPIIMVTGRGDEVDRIIGLEVGADDYIAKPFSPRELVARIRSVLRRTEGDTKEEVVVGEPGKIADFAGWTLDLNERKLYSPSHEAVELTPGEFNLLTVFVSHRNRVLSREQLLDYTQGEMATAFDRSIDVQVLRLRRKIEPNPKKPVLIKTLRNAGYIFAAPVDWR